MLASTILSAQATDASVNRATEKLFARFKSIKDFADAPLDEIEKYVSGINFYKNKAKNIKTCAAIILEKHGGEVPQTMEALVELPGVARKTANIVLSNAFGKNEGIAVDTHVMRLSQRLGLTKKTTPEKIEQTNSSPSRPGATGRTSRICSFCMAAGSARRAPRNMKDVCCSISVRRIISEKAFIVLAAGRMQSEVREFDFSSYAPAWPRGFFKSTWRYARYPIDLPSGLKIPQGI